MKSGGTGFVNGVREVILGAVWRQHFHGGPGGVPREFLKEGQSAIHSPERDRGGEDCGDNGGDLGHGCEVGSSRVDFRGPKADATHGNRESGLNPSIISYILPHEKAQGATLELVEAPECGLEVGRVAGT